MHFFIFKVPTLFLVYYKLKKKNVFENLLIHTSLYFVKNEKLTQNLCWSQSILINKRWNKFVG